jgi:hypothetical protein
LGASPQQAKAPARRGLACPRTPSRAARSLTPAAPCPPPGFLPQVSQIKTALAELERGNTAAFQMGKEARRAEKELAQKFKSDLKLGSQGVIATESGTAAVKVDAKYAHMAAAATLATASKAGAADAAWDD